MKRRIFQSITVKILGPTDTKGQRLKAIAYAGSIVEPRNWDLEIDDQAEVIALKLMEKLEWLDKSEINDCGYTHREEWVFTLKEK